MSSYESISAAWQRCGSGKSGDDGKIREHRKYEGLFPFVRCGSGTRRRCGIWLPLHGAVKKTKKNTKKNPALHGAFIFLNKATAVNPYIKYGCGTEAAAATAKLANIETMDV